VLYEQIVKRGEGLISHLGTVAIKTGHYTGRAANEKFIVDEPTRRSSINYMPRPIRPDLVKGLDINELTWFGQPISPISP
jgi:phosphoenolpyruvate carboxykinase (ATP)